MIPKFRTVLFDLDGTLTDPKEGITRCAQYALRAFGIREKRDNLVRFIGPSLHENFERFYGFSRGQTERAVAIYRRRFAPKGMYENEVYGGVPALLADLRRAGAKLAIASTKAQFFVEQILEHFQLLAYFDAVWGSEFDGSRAGKRELISCALDSLGVHPSDAVMVGDRCFDAQGAEETGVPFIGALYGYGTQEEMEPFHPVAYAKDIPALSALLLQEEPV